MIFSNRIFVFVAQNLINITIIILSTQYNIKKTMDNYFVIKELNV